MKKWDQTITMKKINLSNEEKAALELQHNKCRDKKESDRIKAVLLRSEGWVIPMIAQALRIHEGTIARHLNDYKDGKLKIESGGSHSALNDKQTQALITHLEANTYQSTAEIIAYIQKKYKITYSIPGINKWLHRNNFSYKKPKGYPYKASEEQQEKFIKAYSRLKKRLSSEDRIMFMDACHPSMVTKITHGWIKKGQSKAIETSGSRTRINLIGALDLGELSKPVVGSYSTVDSESIIDFLNQLRKHTHVPGKIYLVLDRAGYHCSAEVKKASKALNIKLFYLPPYSPNLNPIERLWKVMNQHARNNKFFKTANDFRQSINCFFKKTLRTIANSLDGRINDNFQKLDYAF